MPTLRSMRNKFWVVLDQVSPAGRRAALQKLIGGLERLDMLMERNRSKLESAWQARGVEFSKLTEDEWKAPIDEIQHERAL